MSDTKSEKSETSIVCTENGPYLVFGQNVIDTDGSVHFCDGSKPVALCACGRSKNKPLCDGSHKIKP